MSLKAFGVQFTEDRSDFIPVCTCTQKLPTQNMSMTRDTSAADGRSRGIEPDSLLVNTHCYATVSPKCNAHARVGARTSVLRPRDEPAQAVNEPAELTDRRIYIRGDG